MTSLEKWTCAFLLAPAGWGKTSLLFQLFERNRWNILFISPLKSLEQEVQKKLKQYEKKDYFFKALTAEKASNFLDQLSLVNKENLLVVFDEIHLWNHWGASFRPRLWECFFRVANEGHPFLALTATLREDFKHEWEFLLTQGGYSHEFIDFGNGKIENRPLREVSYHGFSKRTFLRRLFFEIDKNERCLIFCQYKKDVKKLTQILIADGLDAKSCVGGKSLEFVNYCEANGDPQIIISTSVLSHGVNLGQIKKVFISYEILEWDLYLQMIARGGRGGGDYEVFCFQQKKTSPWNKIKISLFDRYLSLFYA